MSFIITPTPDPIPAVRTDSTKLAKLKTKVETMLTAAKVTKDTPIDIFELVVEIHKALPTGLAHEDFDGNDVQAIVDDLLRVV